MILDKIVQHKSGEVERQKGLVPEQKLLEALQTAPKPVPFRQALLDSTHPVSLIAEVKKASPSKGLIRPDFSPVDIALTYAQNGAAAISVLTDEEFFQGHLTYLRAIRETVSLPLLRKEFIIDSYQILESRAAGADAILLIVACLTPHQLADYRQQAAELGMDVLVEVHDERELEAALTAGADLIGINNRDLRTFETTLAVTERLAPHIPAHIPFVSESGIFTRDDVKRVEAAGARAVLVGESLMRRSDIGAHMTHLLGLETMMRTETSK